MALATASVLVSDTIQTLRVNFNALLTEFEDFSFDAYSGVLTFDNDLELEGDLTLSGTVYSEGAYLYLNYNEDHTGVSSGSAGLRIDRGTAADAILKFDETDDLWKVGLYGGSFTAISLTGHTHDTRYYTETEVDSLLTNYYTDDEVDSLFEAYYPSNTIDTMLTGYFNIPSTVVGTGLKVYTHNASVNDDASITLPTVTNSGFGWVTVEGAEAYTMFIIDGNGIITLISNSANVVANADTDSKLCVGGAAAPYEPAAITNKLGGAKVISVVLWYN